MDSAELEDYDDVGRMLEILRTKARVTAAEPVADRLQNDPKPSSSAKICAICGLSAAVDIMTIFIRRFRRLAQIEKGIVAPGACAGRRVVAQGRASTRCASHGWA